jgi:hypothetical protein
MLTVGIGYRHIDSTSCRCEAADQLIFFWGSYEKKAKVKNELLTSAQSREEPIPHVVGSDR